jgi:uncharacterized protein
MKEIILDKLTQLEQEHNIRILLACESGSRAWGFPSPDSDYDVRFIYAHPEDWYLGIHEKADVVELPVNEVLDINGWDLRKALRLAAKSNAVVFEWMQSPILYRHSEDFLSGFRELAPGCFSPIAAMHHYLSMAKKKYEECLADEDVKLKRYMYCLRAVLSGLWIAHRKSIPPMELVPLLDEMPDANLRQKVMELVQLKATKEEGYRHSHEPLLEKFLSEGIAECESVAASLPSRKADYDVIDAFFRNTLRTK